MRLRKIRILFIVVLILLISGCTSGGYSMRNGNIEFYKQEISGSYDNFNGHKEKRYRFKEGTTISFSSDFSTENGSLLITVKNKSNDTIIYQTHDSDSGTVKIDESGNYTIRIEGENHKGHFNLSWTVE